MISIPFCNLHPTFSMQTPTFLSLSDSSAGRAAGEVHIRPRGQNNGASEKSYGPVVNWQLSAASMFVSIWTSESQSQNLFPPIHIHILHGRHKPHYESLLVVELPETWRTCRSLRFIISENTPVSSAAAKLYWILWYWMIHSILGVTTLSRHRLPPSSTPAFQINRRPEVSWQLSTENISLPPEQPLRHPSVYGIPCNCAVNE